MKRLTCQPFPILCFVLFALFFAEHLLFAFVLPERAPFSCLLCGTFADLFWPCMLLTCALFFLSRVLMIGFSLSFAAVLLFKTANLAFFLHAMDVLTPANIRLLAAHTDLEAILSLFRPRHFAMAATAAAGFVSVAVLIPLAGFRYLRNAAADREGADAFRTLLLFILLGGIAANVWYRRNSEEMGKGYFCREFPARPAEIFVSDFLRDPSVAVNREDAVPVSGYDPERISPESRAVLTEWGVLPRSGKTAAPLTPEIRKILIIAVESLQTDYLRICNPGMPEGLTPYLDSLASEHIFFRNYFTGSQPTAWAMDSIFLSRTDFELDLRMNNVSLCDILRERGWRSFYFSPVSGMCFRNGPDFRKLFRMDEAFFMEDLFGKYGMRGSHYWGLGDDDVYEAAFRILAESGQEKFLAVISTIDLHDPYAVTGSAAREPSTGMRFSDSLRATDRNLEVFLSRFMESAMFDEHTLVAVTADHSATIGVNYTKRPDFLPDRIPLILISKNKCLQDLFDTDLYASQLDLAPTLLGLLGLPVPVTFMGQDLRSKRSFALSKSPDRVMIHLPSGIRHVCVLSERDRTKEERALRELYRAYYPLPDGGDAQKDAHDGKQNPLKENGR